METMPKFEANSNAYLTNNRIDEDVHEDLESQESKGEITPRKIRKVQTENKLKQTSLKKNEGCLNAG